MQLPSGCAAPMAGDLLLTMARGSEDSTGYDHSQVAGNQRSKVDADELGPRERRLSQSVQLPTENSRIWREREIDPEIWCPEYSSRRHSLS